MPNFAADKLAAAIWARDMLADGTALILDSETTGLGSDARICQLAIIDLGGNVLLDTYVNPQCPIPPDAIAIHGITDEMVKDALPLDVIFYQSIDPLISDRMFIIYNAEYDLRVIRQHMNVADIRNNFSFFFACAMKEYARFVGDWNTYHKSYRWQKLPPIENYPPHQALSDCFATLALIKHMAAFVEPQTVDDIPF